MVLGDALLKDLRKRLWVGWRTATCPGLGLWPGRLFKSAFLDRGGRRSPLVQSDAGCLLLS